MSTLLSGKKTYIAGCLMVLHGLGQALGIFHPGVGDSGFDSGQDSLQMAQANIEILLGLAVVFIRLGQKKTERVLLDAMKGKEPE